MTGPVLPMGSADAPLVLQVVWMVGGILFGWCVVTFVAGCVEAIRHTLRTRVLYRFYYNRARTRREHT